jgi:hypothetical protein
MFSKCRINSIKIIYGYGFYKRSPDVKGIQLSIQ